MKFIDYQQKESLRKKIYLQLYWEKTKYQKRIFLSRQKLE